MSNIINRQISANISTPLVFKEESNISLTDETLSLVGTAQKGPAFVPQQVSSFSKDDNVLNTWENVFGDFDKQNTKHGPIAARVWLESEKTQLSYTRVLGSPLSENVGFIVGDNILSGSSSYGIKGSNPFSNDLGDNGRTSFLGSIIENRDTTGYISPHKQYLEQTNITSPTNKTVCFVTDVVMMTSGSAFYLQNSDVDNINIISKKKDLSTKNSSENAFIGSTVSSSSLPMIYVQGLKNDSKNVLDYYYDGNTNKNFELDDINSDISQILYRGHFSYAKFRSLDKVRKPSAENKLKYLIMSGSGGWNAGEKNFENFKSPFKKSKTPWIVSQPLNREGIDDFSKKDLHKKCKKLFRFFSYDDGAAGNRFRFQIKPRRLGNVNAKVEIEKWSTFDIDLYEFINGNFDLLESFRDLNLNPFDEKYICNIIGTEHSVYNTVTKKIENKGLYKKTNNYVYVEVNDKIEDKQYTSDVIPSGFMPYPRLDINKNNITHVSSKDASSNININELVVMQNPLSYVSNHLFVYDKDNDKFKFKNRYWGVLFDHVSVKKFDNVLIAGQKKNIMFDTFVERRDNHYSNFHDYTKYFKNDYATKDNNIWVEDLSDNNTDTTNAFFHLEKILYPYIENSRSMWDFSFYQRNGIEVSKIIEIDEDLYKYVNIDSLLKTSTLDDSINAKFLKFDLMTYGGFDGLNDLDDFKREHHNFSILREYDGEIANSSTGQTHDAYSLATDIIFDDGNIRSDIFCLPGISHIDLIKKTVQRANDEQVLFVVDFPEYGFNLNSINEKYISYDGLIKDPYFYKNVNKSPDDYGDERDDIQHFINQGTENTINKFKEIYLFSDYTFVALNSIVATIDNVSRVQIPPSIFVINSLAEKSLNQTLDSIGINNTSFITYNTVLNRNFVYNNNKFDDLLIKAKKNDVCINPVGLMTAGNEIQLLSSNALNKNNMSNMKLYNNTRIKQTIMRELNNLLTVQPIFQGNSILFSNDSQSGLFLNLKVELDQALKAYFEEYIERGIIKRYSTYVDIANLNSKNSNSILNNRINGTISFTLFGPGPDNFVQLDINNLINNIKEFTNSNDINIINSTI
jgi:hypothetical protein